MMVLGNLIQGSVIAIHQVFQIKKVGYFPNRLRIVVELLCVAVVSTYFWIKVYNHYRQLSRRIHPALQVAADQVQEEQWV